MYLLINPDDSLNTVGEHPLPSIVPYDALTLIEHPEHTVADILGNIPLIDAQWDRVSEQVSRRADAIKGSSAWRARVASQIIHQQYPLYRQLNYLRSRDKDTLKTMVRFIDACRAWSNDQSVDPDQIHTFATTLQSQ